ncbi:hypothetical protein HK103_004585 [Boothiomyces macroporosus]|uniref:Uncharacterized protein n=1 Tax=Boothiomyces macroporosus TaxID=261099 RepID=A0AAD5UGD9_9FUNG|nr:hypothetical protein HK103_004585 [Boothiomyces macroporosus]
MDKADADFIQHLFKENNKLRATITSLHRELHNVKMALDEADAEIKALKLKETTARADVKTPGLAQTPSVLNVNVKVAEDKSTTRDTGEMKFIVERQEAEIFQMGEELYKLRADLLKETEKEIQASNLVEELTAEVKELREYKEKRIAQDEELAAQANDEEVLDEAQLLQKLQDAEQMCANYKLQMISLANEANAIQNAQQNQLQSVEGLIEGIRDEYEEFISVTRIENESFQARQKHEYDQLKEEFENHKNHSFEEKKRTMMEYQNILSSMQSQFDEYRTTTEILFNVEMVKLEEEITSQASRYEQEIMYVIQAKDKFYMDMMITKDAKIMGLIEGSDLQSIMQKHELDIENLRKEHAKDVERVKSEHESESKNVMLLLQRQNVSLESKTEKLQTHLKNIEGRMKELMNTIENKNKAIQERDEMRIQMEKENQVQFGLQKHKIAELTDKITKLGQEKERLRHKVIRLNLNAKGEGENSIENMLKRLTYVILNLQKDLTNLRKEFDDVSTKYNSSIGINQDLAKKVQELEKNNQFLEKEMERRAMEYRDMTSTFEEFLAGRAKQAKKERNLRLLELAQKEEELKKLHRQHTEKVPTVTNSQNRIIKASIPDRTETARSSQAYTTNMLDRGYMYLKRFKNLSKAFANGDFRALQNIEKQQETQPGPWSKVV